MQRLRGPLAARAGTRSRSIWLASASSCSAAVSDAVAREPVEDAPAARDGAGAAARGSNGFIRPGACGIAARKAISAQRQVLDRLVEVAARRVGDAVDAVAVGRERR